MSKPLQTQFKRIETKFIITQELFDQLQEQFAPYMEADAYAYSSITNIYFDNPDFQMIQDATNKLNGREKIRMRTYASQPDAQSEAFLEIKKKENEVGYKYRVTSTAEKVLNFVQTGQMDEPLADQNVSREMNILLERYGQIQPKMHIAYSRYSMKGINDDQIRITFDSNLRFRHQDVHLGTSALDQSLVEAGEMIMEIKVPGDYPDWLAEILDGHGLVNQSFSKYGVAYKKSQEILEVFSA